MATSRAQPCGSAKCAGRESRPVGCRRMCKERSRRVGPACAAPTKRLFVRTDCRWEKLTQRINTRRVDNQTTTGREKLFEAERATLSGPAGALLASRWAARTVDTANCTPSGNLLHAPDASHDPRSR